MRLPKKVEQAYQCLKNFQESNTNSNINELIGILSPMFFNNNEHIIKISVGKKVNTAFHAMLTSCFTNFNALLLEYQGEPQILFKDYASNANTQCYCSLNLAMMSGLKIDVLNREKGHYIIDFVITDDGFSLDYRMELKMCQ